jgi:hypothetical protein
VPSARDTALGLLRLAVVLRASPERVAARGIPDPSLLSRRLILLVTGWLIGALWRGGDARTNQVITAFAVI